MYTMPLTPLSLQPTVLCACGTWKDLQSLAPFTWTNKCTAAPIQRLQDILCTEGLALRRLDLTREVKTGPITGSAEWSVKPTRRAFGGLRQPLTQCA